MNKESLKAIQNKAFKPRTTDSKGTNAAPNLLADRTNNNSDPIQFERTPESMDLPSDTSLSLATAGAIYLSF